MFAAGVKGLLVLMTLSFTNKKNLPPEGKKRLQGNGPITGGVLAGLVVIYYVVQLASR